ncbi:uncharacterized protein M437DRAFT_70535 [Aureobasidium melanogenum CBS 110374]|uniref:Uncharacterized protein n=1 Tax=Aureobasidium melanogenum (strain CBS 110374) TaxID=1043003 RepID=A0A074VJH6_AURM1|nr:uncharacterized protein M437DRAFT_70535 [Aureobasidium melanogenum CBS 110374]KEQ57767.1 hypothetical protein M437DRAFT_70535 [Aureobasidium melanogenum CBS 110374]
MAPAPKPQRVQGLWRITTATDLRLGTSSLQATHYVLPCVCMNKLHNQSQQKKETSQYVELSHGGWMASMTKLQTAVATMIAVEKDLVDLDEDVIQLLPKPQKRKILHGFDNETKTQLRGL